MVHTFRDPKSPWKRGPNADANRLLRQSFPCSLELIALTAEQLDAAAGPGLQFSDRGLGPVSGGSVRTGRVDRWSGAS